MLDNFLILLPFAVVWAVFFLLASRTWQLTSAFIPFCVYGLYYGYGVWQWLFVIPFLSILVWDLHIVLSDPKFNKGITALSFLMAIPFIVIYLYYADEINKGTLLSKIWGYIIHIAIIIYVSKLWIADVLLLFINRLYVIEKNSIETKLTNKFTTKAGRAITYTAVFYNLGRVEVSGMFYLYLRMKVNPEDKLKMEIKKGWLGTEYISGFPKIIEKGHPI